MVFVGEFAPHPLIGLGIAVGGIAGRFEERVGDFDRGEPIDWVVGHTHGRCHYDNLMLLGNCIANDPGDLTYSGCIAHGCATEFHYKEGHSGGIIERRARGERRVKILRLMLLRRLALRLTHLAAQ